MTLSMSEDVLFNERNTFGMWFKHSWFIGGKCLQCINHQGIILCFCKEIHPERKKEKNLNGVLAKSSEWTV